jgi:hypothetical protein
MPEDRFDARALRVMLAERRITTTRFAVACGLTRAYLYHILAERVKPGELGRIKIARGLAALGLDREAPHAA